MIYKEFSPGTALRLYVRSRYYFQGEVDNVGKTYDFRFPSDGGPELIVNAGDPFLAGSRPERM